MSSGKKTSLDNAPDHIKLAVDLIQLLEVAEIESSIAVKALEIALDDFANRGS